MTKPSKLRVLASAPEFAPGVDEPPAGLDRRELMKLLAAGAGLAGLGSLAGCMETPRERIVPRVEQPPELVPGVPLEYATAMVIDGFATGLVVRTLEARPIKVEGNPEHPASLGATSAHHQASVLDLYDPHRASSALDAGVPAGRDRLMRVIARREAMPGLWFLMYPQSSPVLADLMARVRRRHPGARFAFHSPLERRQVYEGARRAFGRPLEAHYRFDRAGVIVSLDADFTAAMPSSVRWSREFARRRRLPQPDAEMSRLYVAEPRPSPTGSLADHHLAVAPSRVARLAAALLARIEGRALPRLALHEQRWIDGAAADLVARRGAGLVLAGDRQPAEVHALVHAIDAAIGAAGSTVEYAPPALIAPLGDGLVELAAAIRANQVQTLVIVEANPVYTTPPELDFAGLLARVPDTWCAALEVHETAQRCRRFLPLAHFMERWADARAYDGTITLVQPLIRPLHESVSLLELVAAFAGDERPDVHRMLRERYGAGAAGELTWQRALQRGLIPNTRYPTETPAARPPAAEATAEETGFELAFDASPAVYDGRFAGNAWLQELPKPHTKLTWGNAAVISPATAAALDVEHGDLVRVTHGVWHVELPVYVLPGHADHCASVELGYGRRAGGPIAEGVGVDVYRLRRLARPDQARVALAATGGHRELAVTQQHFDQGDREIALSAELAHYRANPSFTAAHRGPLANLLPRHFEGTPRWGMSIDTMICTGCSACVIACQAENNIPVVGRAGVIANREMHWLRIDTYREQRGDQVEHVHQPMLCQHCEQAPCEYVCPTYATQHSPDGLNEMVYNRCIGTRFCSNNCPYKVRRFNWFDYTEDTPKRQRLRFNPSVTVRARGVMEKCTYCVQRIRGAEIAARKERREIRPNEVMTACQQACPTGAIQFGLMTHDQTEAVRWRREPRAYAVLHDLGTRPMTIYLAKITNPRPGGGER